MESDRRGESAGAGPASGPTARGRLRALGRAALDLLMEAAVPALLGGVTGALAGGLLAAGAALVLLPRWRWLVYVAGAAGAAAGGLTGAYQAAKHRLLRG